MSRNFTPQAERFWEALSAEGRLRFLNNVWCVHCADVRSIVRFKGRVERGNLLLEGRCATCGKTVARVVEGS